jgi:hypothetical protein
MEVGIAGVLTFCPDYGGAGFYPNVSRQVADVRTNMLGLQSRPPERLEPIFRQRTVVLTASRYGR